MIFLDNVAARLPMFAALGAIHDLIAASPPMAQPGGSSRRTSSSAKLEVVAMAVQSVDNLFTGTDALTTRLRAQVLVTASGSAWAHAVATGSSTLMVVAATGDDTIDALRVVYAPHPPSPFVYAGLLRALLLADGVFALAEDGGSPALPAGTSVPQEGALAPVRLWRHTGGGGGIGRWLDAPVLSAQEIEDAEAAVVDLADRRLAHATPRGGRIPGDAAVRRAVTREEAACSPAAITRPRATVDPDLFSPWGVSL